MFFGNRENERKNVHGGNIFNPFCDMGENFTPWGWGTQNLCAKTGTDSGAGSCVNFRKSSKIARWKKCNHLEIVSNDKGLDT